MMEGVVWIVEATELATQHALAPETLCGVVLTDVTSASQFSGTCSGKMGWVCDVSTRLACVKELGGFKLRAQASSFKGPCDMVTVPDYTGALSKIH